MVSDFTFTWVRGNHSCHAKPLNNTPLFPKTTSCPAVIIGETGDSRRNLGLYGSAKLAFFRQLPNESRGEFGGGPRYVIRAYFGRIRHYSERSAAIFFAPLFLQSILGRRASVHATIQTKSEFKAPKRDSG